MRLSPAVAATRLAVRRCLADLPVDRPVLVAVSGGPDSMALAAATAFEGRAGRQLILLTVDHGLQAGSADRASAVVEWGRAFGYRLGEVATVSVQPAGQGIEAAARDARYRAFAERADYHGAAAVLLGHTADDQAETVLLRLGRGSGARSLAGMARVRGRYRRPFLGLPRAQVRTAAAAEQLPTWSDPQNFDPRFARARVRHRLLPVLEETIGPAAVGALARSAALLRDDADALDCWAARESTREDALAVASLAELPRAVRTRVIRLAAIRAGCPVGPLTAGQIAEVERLVTDWHGQGPIALPGGLVARRRCGRLRFDAYPGDRTSGRRSDSGDRAGDRGSDR